SRTRHFLRRFPVSPSEAFSVGRRQAGGVRRGIPNLPQEKKRGHAAMSWTDERVELLKKLWSDGLSASQIANQLGGVSREGHIGKVHRLSLHGRGKPEA